MKKYLKYIIGVVVLISTSGCEDFLSRMPDNITTIDQTFVKEKDAIKYLANCYNYIEQQAKYQNNRNGFSALTDELDVTYADDSSAQFNLGAMSPTKGWYNNWSTLYDGIRSCSYFMMRVNEVTDITPKKKAQYYNEARALRAIFYFNLFRQYGPLVILPEVPIAPDASSEQMDIARSTVGETVAYIERELTDCANSGELPIDRPVSNADWGRISQAICKAVKSRLLLYAASDFWNRDINTPYKDFKDKTGKQLFDYTNDGKIKRWEKARDAAFDIIESGTFDLCKTYYHTDKSKIDPYTSFKNIFVIEWNPEVIFKRTSGDLLWEMESHSPRQVGGWSGWGPTQELVDMFFTKNGLPIDEDLDYSEEGFTTTSSTDYYEEDRSGVVQVPFYEAGVYNMYANREPRFYASVNFDNQRWLAPDNNNNYPRVQYYWGGADGGGSTRNYSKTGYGVRKHNSPNSRVQNGKYFDRRGEVLIRYAEILLNYCEALNEVSYNPGVLLYLNQIRERAGIPQYGSELPTPPDQESMREAIHRERSVELALEGHRYFDAIRWLTKNSKGEVISVAEEAFNGPKHGMAANEYKGDFYKRTEFETRVWQKKNNLFPIPQDELYKSRKLVQNPFWEEDKI